MPRLTRSDFNGFLMLHALSVKFQFHKRREDEKFSIDFTCRRSDVIDCSNVGRSIECGAIKNGIKTQRMAP